jgi:glycosyltransferase involved in cell wall biosynthesis
MPLRVDLVFPRFKLLSGAERAILGLAGALVADGHDVRVVCHQFDASCRPRLPSDVTLACSHARLDWTTNRYLNAGSDYLRSFGLRRLLDDTADVCVLFGPSLPLAWRRRKGGVRVLYYCWEPPRALYQDRGRVLSRLGWSRVLVGPALRLYGALDRWLVGRADNVCTSSPFTVAQIEAAYRRSASVVTLGVDRARLDAALPAEHVSPPVVLTVNYLHPRKRVELFLEAASHCRDRWTDPVSRPRWIVVGDGPERGRLEQLAHELGVDSDVVFAGFVPDDQLPQYYAAASCYVHTAVEESFGLSVIEAAYCGTPVVAVAEGGVRDTIEHGETGFLVAPRPLELAASVEAILRSTDSGRSMGLAGHERVSARYRWERGADDIVRLAQQRPT